MKKWLGFIFLPILFMWIAEPLAFFILNPESGGFWQNVLRFIIHFIGGVIIYQCSPSKKHALAYIYSCLYIALIFYLAISTDGNVLEIMGQYIVQRFSLIEELARSSGLLLGVLGAIKSDETES